MTLQKRSLSFAVLLFFICLTQACKEKISDTSQDVTLDDLAVLADKGLAIDLNKVYQRIDQLSKAEKEHDEATAQVRKYYHDKNPFMWVGRNGVASEALLLTEALGNAEEEGLSKRIFRIEQIEKDIHRFGQLDFDEKNTINEVVARLEYQLSKAYFLYATIEQYGYVNPVAVLNKSQVIGKDTIKVDGRLFDMKVERPDDVFFMAAAAAVQSDSFPDYLERLKPQTKLYNALKAELRQAKGSDYRKKVLVNLERSRWRLKDPVERHDKYVFVNVAAQMVHAVSKDSTMVMKVCCGTPGKKTPLLNSYIKKMDINPVWRMPYSIVKTIAGRAGNASYFNSRRYSIYDGAGRKVDPAQVTTAQLLSGRYSVVQAAGKGNSLGKIIFRFDNNFSVYLHDTNSPWVFKQSNRCVSHGCVRLERPYDMAVFLLGEEQADKADDIWYSMQHGAEPADSIQSDRVLKECKVEPKIPVYLSYYTLYPDLSQHIREYSDVYGYDKIIYHHLLPIVK